MRGTPQCCSQDRTGLMQPRGVDAVLLHCACKSVLGLAWLSRSVVSSSLQSYEL